MLGIFSVVRGEKYLTPNKHRYMYILCKRKLFSLPFALNHLVPTSNRTNLINLKAKFFVHH